MLKCYSCNTIIMGYVLVFDIPQGEAVEKVRINRMLHRRGAKLVQQSLWKHESIRELVDIGMRIRKIGGHAEILEECFLF